MLFDRLKIEIAPGSIEPTARSLWSAASEKLHEAEVNLQQMRLAQDRIEFEQGWTNCVDSLEEFWNRFCDEGKSKFKNFQPWAGGIARQRKNDSLLQYLYQARHQSQHGRISIGWNDGVIMIAPGFNGHIKELNMFNDGTYTVNYNPAHPSISEPKLVFSVGNAKLPIVHNHKYSDSYLPPTEHLGQVLDDQSPVRCIQLALTFYQRVLDSAFIKFV